MAHSLIVACWLAPIVTFIVLVFPFLKIGRRWVGVLGFAGPCIAAFMALACLAQRWIAGAHDAVVHVNLGVWVHLPSVQIPFRLHVDGLSLTMMLVVTVVGTIIHAYSISYMKEDPQFRRFFVYLNLFIVMMLTLVMADNLPLLFMGWEGVGLCSYLLIGFWHERPAAAQAGRKAFLVNRIGDAAFLAGMILVLIHAGRGDWETLATWCQSGTSSPVLPAVIALCLLVGAIGKSAQIPLYVWLPDAMEGPTPVSALIHAATMVTAGIYLVVRMRFLYSLVPPIGHILAWVGLITALYAAIVAACHTEMKRILAFSTISQIGYMFVAAGVGAWFAAMFHLVVHAFFKALLFLLAGQVMHETGGEQDIRNLGGLRTSMPWTHRLFIIGSLTLAGVPPLAAYFSKEAILTATYLDSSLLWTVAWLTAGITAFYAMRLYLIPFQGPAKGTRARHEAPPAMLLPSLFLGIGCLAGGFLRPFFLHGQPAAPHIEHILTAASVGVVLLGIAAALIVYFFNRESWSSRLVKTEPVRAAFANQLGWNEVYDKLLVQPFAWFTRVVLYNLLDIKTLDACIDGTAHLAMGVSHRLRILQGGSLHRRTAAVLVGLLAILIYITFLMLAG